MQCTTYVCVNLMKILCVFFSIYSNNIKFAILKFNQLKNLLWDTVLLFWNYVYLPHSNVFIVVIS